MLLLQAYISGQALVILGGPQKLLQTIYVDETETLEAVAIDETAGRIAVCGGPSVFVYHPYGIKDETLKVRIPLCDSSEGADSQGSATYRNHGDKRLG